MSDGNDPLYLHSLLGKQVVLYMHGLKTGGSMIEGVLGVRSITGTYYLLSNGPRLRIKEGDVIVPRGGKC